MGSLDSDGLWCPECGAEYRPGFVECIDCRVALSTEKPPARPRRAADTADHREVVYDLGDWTDDARGALDLMLTSAAVPHGWDQGLLVIPHVREGEVDNLIEAVEEGEIVEEPRAGPSELGEDENAVLDGLAGPVRRLIGYFADLALLSGFSVLLGQGILDLKPSSPLPLRLVLPALVSAYEIVPTALWGRTVGKLVAQTRVVILGDRTPPGWRRAVIRWAVRGSPVLFTLSLLDAAAATVILALAGNVWMVVLYVGILWSPLEQGLHDKAAGTVVV